MHGAHDVHPASIGQVEHRRRAMAACVQFTDGGPRRSLGALDDLVGEILYVVEAVGVAQCGQPLRSHLARGHLGMEVAGHVIRLADIRQDELPDVGVALRASGAVAPHQPADRDPEPFLEAVPTAGADAVAAHVGVVDGGTEQGDQPGLAPARRYPPGRHEHGHVEELARGLVRIVGDEHVARDERPDRMLLEHRGRAEGQTVDVTRCSRHRLGHHATPPVEYRIG